LRRLIINADDLGQTAGVNRAIMECARLGTVTSATLMAGGQAFSDAVGAVKQTHLPVGCHTVLVDGVPVSPIAEVLTLCDGNGFRASIGDLMRAATSGAIAEDEVGREGLAQFRKLQSTGLDVSHFDSHKHAHMFPAIFRPLLQAAKEAGITAVRNPFERPSFNWIATPALWVRGVQTTLLRKYQSSFLTAVKDARLKTPDGTVGIAVTGLLDIQWLQRIIQGLPEGTWELVCHPGYHDAELEKTGTRLRKSREIERQALISDEFRTFLRSERVELLSYWEL
jgi:chitin disaccharide deacetylase